MKRIIQLVLLVVIVVLAYFLATSILTPINFNREYNQRYAVVVEKLKDIRTIQVAYKTDKGYFAGSFDSLIDYYNNGQIAVVRQIGSMDDSIAVAEGRVKRDTINIPVKDTLFNHRGAGFDINQIGIVPFANEPFKLDTITYVTPSKIAVPLFAASVRNEVYLTGLDAQQIVNLNDKQEKMDRFPGLMVGNVVQPNNNAGNWE